MLTDNFELTGSVGYIDVGDASDTGLAVSAHYHGTPAFSLGAGYSTIDDAFTTSLTGRFYF